MKILLIGHNGQVGFELNRILSPHGDLAAVDFPSVDLGDPDSILACLKEHRPQLVVNAAGYTGVDRAESEPDRAMAVNGTAPGIIAEELKKTGGALVHFSTDYVFDGRKATSYREDDETSPLSTYGRSKRAGEQAVIASGVPHLLLRSSWIYGSRGSNFLLTILKLAREREEIRIVDDQFGAPTWSRTVAETTAEILKNSGGLESGGDFGGKSGLYHLAASGETSWYGFAREALDLDPGKEEQRVRRLVPTPTSAYPTPAARPLNSRLDCTLLQRTFSVILPSWEESLRQIMTELAQRG